MSNKSIYGVVFETWQTLPHAVTLSDGTHFPKGMTVYYTGQHNCEECYNGGDCTVARLDRHGVRRVGKYRGSGYDLIEMRAILGWNDSFRDRQVIGLTRSSEHLNKLEAKYMTPQDVKRPEVLNRVPGGLMVRGRKMSEEAKRKMRQNHASKKPGYINPMKGKKKYKQAIQNQLDSRFHKELHSRKGFYSKDKGRFLTFGEYCENPYPNTTTPELLEDIRRQCDNLQDEPSRQIGKQMIDGKLTPVFYETPSEPKE